MKEENNDNNKSERTPKFKNESKERNQKKRDIDEFYITNKKNQSKSLRFRKNKKTPENIKFMKKENENLKKLLKRKENKIIQITKRNNILEEKYSLLKKEISKVENKNQKKKELISELKNKLKKSKLKLEEQIQSINELEDKKNKILNFRTNFKQKQKNPNNSSNSNSKKQENSLFLSKNKISSIINNTFTEKKPEQTIFQSFLPDPKTPKIEALIKNYNYLKTHFLESQKKTCKIQNLSKMLKKSQKHILSLKKNLLKTENLLKTSQTQFTDLYTCFLSLKEKHKREQLNKDLSLEKEEFTGSEEELDDIIKSSTGVDFGIFTPRGKIDDFAKNGFKTGLLKKGNFCQRRSYDVNLVQNRLGDEERDREFKTGKRYSKEFLGNEADLQGFRKERFGGFEGFQGFGDWQGVGKNRFKSDFGTKNDLDYYEDAFGKITGVVGQNFKNNFSNKKDKNFKSDLLMKNYDNNNKQSNFDIKSDSNSLEEKGLPLKFSKFLNPEKNIKNFKDKNFQKFISDKLLSKQENTFSDNKKIPNYKNFFDLLKKLKIKHRFKYKVLNEKTDIFSKIFEKIYKYLNQIYKNIENNNFFENIDNFSNDNLNLSINFQNEKNQKKFFEIENTFLDFIKSLEYTIGKKILSEKFNFIKKIYLIINKTNYFEKFMKKKNDQKIEKIQNCLKHNLENIKNVKIDIIDLEKKVFLFLEKDKTKSINFSNHKRSISDFTFPSKTNNNDNKNILFLLEFFKNLNLKISTESNFIKMKENAQNLEKKIDNYKKSYEMELNELYNTNDKNNFLDNSKIKKLEKKQLLIHEEISRLLKNYIFSTLQEILSKNNFTSFEISTENLIKSFLVFLKNLKKKLFESNYVILKKKNLNGRNFLNSEIFEQGNNNDVSDIYDSHFHKDKDESIYLFSMDIYFIKFVIDFMKKLIFK